MLGEDLVDLREGRISRNVNLDIEVNVRTGAAPEVP